MIKVDETMFGNGFIELNCLLLVSLTGADRRMLSALPLFLSYIFEYSRSGLLHYFIGVILIGPEHSFFILDAGLGFTTGSVSSNTRFGATLLKPWTAAMGSEARLLGSSTDSNE